MRGAMHDVFIVQPADLDATEPVASGADIMLSGIYAILDGTDLRSIYFPFLGDQRMMAAQVYR
jgi:hypothetical protein